VGDVWVDVWAIGHPEAASCRELQIRGQNGECAKKSIKKALKRCFQGRKLVAGAGFVPRHAEILSHLSHFSSLFVYTPSLRGNTHALQFGVRFGVRWRRGFWAFNESNLLAPSKKVMGIEAKVVMLASLLCAAMGVGP
jgi:hypothetical protein